MTFILLNMSITEDKASLKETKLSKLIYFTKKKAKMKVQFKTS